MRSERTSGNQHLKMKHSARDRPKYLNIKHEVFSHFWARLKNELPTKESLGKRLLFVLKQYNF